MHAGNKFNEQAAADPHAGTPASHIGRPPPPSSLLPAPLPNPASRPASRRSSTCAKNQRQLASENASHDETSSTAPPAQQPPGQRATPLIRTVALADSAGGGRHHRLARRLLWPRHQRAFGQGRGGRQRGAARRRRPLCRRSSKDSKSSVAGACEQRRGVDWCGLGGQAHALERRRPLHPAAQKRAREQAANVEQRHARVGAALQQRRRQLQHTQRAGPQLRQPRAQHRGVCRRIQRADVRKLVGRKGLLGLRPVQPLKVGRVERLG
eukprot:365442-Chlamydomonas_euryale.AAC.19